MSDSPHVYYSLRTGKNPHTKGLPLSSIADLFQRVYSQFEEDGYFVEAFGFHCVDNGFEHGTVRDIELQVLLDLHKENLLPVYAHWQTYSEEDLLDVIEFLYQHVSKPIDGAMHNWNGCGMHWKTFNKADGKHEFRAKINSLLNRYENAFELSPAGEILHKAEAGFEPIFEAEVPSKDVNVVSRVNAATLAFRRHGASLDDRRKAVRDLADVFEYLRPQVRELLTSNDEGDLFNIANNFGVRHHNDKQKTGYDTALWLSWMFYFYLATVHLLLRKIDSNRTA